MPRAAPFMGELINATSSVPTNKTNTAPSGEVPIDDGNCVRDDVKYEPHNRGMRDERGWTQQWYSIGYSGRFLIPNAKDRLIIYHIFSNV